ncbi:MAG: hypothetical protein J6331_05415, partial [Lentisphaeria bacterium]|nr:hypothetical protein [Lentisphaeria bacterium]
MKTLLNTPYCGRWTKSCRLAEKLSSELFLLRGGGEAGKVPGVRETAKKYRVSCGTAASALRLLAERGILRQFPGKGSFLASGKKEAAKIALLYDPDIHQKKEYVSCLQRKVYDFLTSRPEKSSFLRIVPVNVFDRPERLHDVLEDFRIVVACAIPAGETLARIPAKCRKVLYGVMEKGPEAAFAENSLFVRQDIAGGIDAFFGKHPPGEYGKIVLFFTRNCPFSRILCRFLEEALDRFSYPSKNIERISVPATNFTAVDVARNVLERKKSSFAGTKTLLVSCSDHYLAGLLQAFTPAERPDILQFEGEVPAPADLVLEGKGFLWCLHTRYDRIASCTLQAVSLLAENPALRKGVLCTEMEFR